MNRHTFLNFKQSLLLILLYFVPPGLFLFLTLTVPQLHGRHLQELYISVNSIVAATVGLFPIMIFIRKKFSIQINWGFKTLNLTIIFLIILLAILTTIVTIPLNNPFEFVKNILKGNVVVLYWNITKFNWVPAVSFIGTVLLAPIIEEILFRGQLLGLLLKRYSPIISIILTSIIFSLVHLRINDFLSLFIWGFLFGIVYYKTESLVFSILLHCLSNLSAYLFGHKYVGITEIVLFKDIVIWLSCVIITVIILRYFDGIIHKMKVS